MYVCLPDDLGEQEAVGAVVVSEVTTTPQLWAGQRVVPELVNETADMLFLCLQPLVIAIPCLGEGGERGEGEGGREEDGEKEGEKN